MLEKAVEEDAGQNFTSNEKEGDASVAFPLIDVDYTCIYQLLWDLPLFTWTGRIQ